jgi:heptosyltransferase-2
MKILVRAPNWLGDAVMSIPALELIRHRWPDAEISILARASVAELYRGQAYANRLVALEPAARHQGVLGVARLASELRRERYDLAVLLQNAFAAAWLAWRAAIPERIGYDRDGRGWLLTRAVPVPQAGEIPPHETYYYLELLRRAGWIDRLPEVTEIRLCLEGSAIERAEMLLRRAGARPGRAESVRAPLRIAFAAGAAYGSAKCWPASRYAALADRLIAEFDADMILCGAVAERGVAERITAEMAHRPVMLVGETPIGALPAVLASCDLFVGNDSGAMHVAGAVGLPVVAIFGPTDPKATAPLTPRVTVVQQPVSCSPCFLRHCPVDHRCMTRVELEAVYAAARRWLERSSTRA